MRAPERGPLTADHLQRKAFVYVRQSSDFQVRNHVERQKLQYGLADHARELGFGEVEVIDEDQGTSGGGVERPGFDRLLTAVCRGTAGLVLSLEASRLARNGRDWHTLLDFCAIMSCLVGDRDRLYDPGRADDRLYLGMQGGFSEMELAMFRERSLESRMELAARGELFATLPAGYEKVDRWHIEMSPDQRERDALALVFSKFAELRSVRQVYLWFLREGVEIPVRHQGKGIVWKLPTNTGLNALLSNPIYAGAYAFGRRRQETVIENGRKRVRSGIRKAGPEEWTVLLRDRHEGYITWEEYARNQELIAANNSKVRGAVRPGRALLAGLLRCGRCTRRMQVRDNGRAVGYHCRGDHGNAGACQDFGALRAERAVGAALLAALQPLGVEAALQAWEGGGAEAAAEERLARSALAEAQYLAERAQAQFEAVEPANRNVFQNLARKWERSLVQVRACEERLEALGERQREAATRPEREAYLALGEDLERAWNDERATPELRKAVLRAALVEIAATVEEERIRLRLHWKGGDHTELEVPRSRTGQHRWSTAAATVDLVRELARSLSDPSIAGLLNRLGKRTSKGNSWTRDRLRSLRSSHGIAVYREGERRERGELVLSEAAERLGVDPGVVRRLIRTGALPARQACKGAPWLIAGQALETAAVRAALAGRSALAPDPDQQALEFA